MGVRVKLRVTLGGRAVEAVALANTAFETDEPRPLVPQALRARFILPTRAFQTAFATSTKEWSSVTASTLKGTRSQPSPPQRNPS